MILSLMQMCTCNMGMRTSYLRDIVDNVYVVVIYCLMSFRNWGFGHTSNKNSVVRTFIIHLKRLCCLMCLSRRTKVSVFYVLLLNDLLNSNVWTRLSQCWWCSLC